MKKIIKIMTITISIMLCLVIFASALEPITNVKTTEIVKIPSKTYNGVDYTGVGGVSTDLESGKTSLFVCKKGDDEQYAALYYYPNITDTSARDTYYVYRLPKAGHANGMTITDEYIYVTGWTHGEDNIGVGQQEGNTYNNWILEIAISTIKGLDDNRNGDIIPESAVKIFKPVYHKPNPTATSKFNYYKKTIASITQYIDDDTFIIGRPTVIETTDNETQKKNTYFEYRIAKIETDPDDGKRRFVVSTDYNGRFLVKNNMYIDEQTGSVYDPTGQDICYSPDAGFLIAKWFGNLGSKCKNIILRVDLSELHSGIETIDEDDYKYYVPDQIVVDHTETRGRGELKYTKFEIESISISPRNKRMLIACNVEYTEEFRTAYETAENKSLGGDRVFKLTYTDGSNILLPGKS